MRFYICEVLDQNTTPCIFSEATMRSLWKKTGGDIARCIRHGALITNEMEAINKQEVRKVWGNKELVLSDRQKWLLIYMLSLSPRGISVVNAVPYSCSLEGRNYPNPGGIGMANVRGLEKRGFVEEPHSGLFYLTAEGIQAARKVAERRHQK